MLSKASIKIIVSMFLLATANANANHHASDAHDAGATKAKQALTQILAEFLHAASYGGQDAHEKFWHDDLIYTSSNGTRTTKQLIVSGITPPPADAPVEEPASLFSADDIQIRVLNKTTAVVAFKLVATPNDAAEAPAPSVRFYLNTGTFVFENNEWRAIAWQATTMAEANTQ